MCLSIPTRYHIFIHPSIQSSTTYTIPRLLLCSHLFLNSITLHCSHTDQRITLGSRFVKCFIRPSFTTLFPHRFVFLNDWKILISGILVAKLSVFGIGDRGSETEDVSEALVSVSSYTHKHPSLDSNKNISELSAFLQHQQYD